ncbi:MAG: alanine racemase [Phycisphaeraceae bacterium]
MIQLQSPPRPAEPVRIELSAMQEQSWLEVDLARLEHNAAAIRRFAAEQAQRLAPRRRAPIVCASLKKDGYGLGAGAMSHRLIKAGCGMLAVYSPAEAERLAERGLSVPILVLMPVDRIARTDALYRPAVAERLHLAVHDEQQLRGLNQTGQTLGIRLPVHLYFDTGMARGGLSVEQFHDLVRRGRDFRHVRFAGVCSHLATGATDADFVQEQLQRFHHAVDEIAGLLPDDCLRHLANSFGSLRDAATHLDMIRPGLALLGYGSELFDGPAAGEAPELEPVVRWMSRVVHVQRYPRRTPVGYGSTHKLKRESILGVVPVGYADGYPMGLSNKASVMVRAKVDSEGPGHRIHAETATDCHVLGQVNMDQIVIDLTDVPCDDANDLKGRVVEVYGREPSASHSLPRLADLAKTHVYELLCRVSPTVKRVYV